MKRVLIVAAVLLGGLFVAAPAQADDPVCYSVPALPDECLSEATYAHIVGLTTERDRMVENYASLNFYASGLQQQTVEQRDALWAQASVVQQLRADLSSARQQVAIAYDWIDSLTHRVTVLRAKVKALKALI